MSLTSLNLGHVTPSQRQRLVGTDCPMCGAKKEKRVEVGGFGQELFACGECGYEFKENQ